MKKTFLSVMMLAAAAFTVTSCSQSEEFIAGKENKCNITLIAGNPEVESETRTQLDADGLTPMWKVRDAIHAVTNLDEYDGGSVTRFDFYSTNTKLAKTASFVINNAQASSFSDFLGADYFFAHHGSGFYSLTTDDNGKTSVWMNLNAKQTPTRNQFDPETDMMISKKVKIDAKRNYETNPVELQFKRLTGILKLNIQPLSEEHNGIKGLNITKVSLTTNDKADNFAGSFDVNLDNGDISKRNDGKGIETLNIKNFKIGDGNALYMCVLPTTIKAGKPMNIVIEAGGKKFKKEVNVEQDIEVPGYTITTFNIMLEDPSLATDPVPDANNKVKVSGNVIDMSVRGATGTLYKWHVKKALEANPAQVVIKGGMNATDFNSLLSVLREIKTPVDLDITGANIVKGGMYINYKGLEKTTRANEIPSDFFRGCQLSSVELPESVTGLGSNIFQDITTLKSATLSSYSYSSDSGEDIFAGCTSMQELYVKEDGWSGSPTLSTSFYARDYVYRDLTEKVDVYISAGWDIYAGLWDENYWADPSSNLWYGYTWKSVTYLYD